MSEIKAKSVKRRKIRVDAYGNTQYLWGEGRLIMQTVVCSDNGIVWCENCYSSEVPILVIHTQFGKFWICQRCINLMFSLRKEEASERK